MKSTLAKVSVVAMLTLLVSFVAAYFARASNLKKVTPFTLNVTQTVKRGDGLRVKHLIYASRSDGSLATWDERDWGNGPVMVKTIRDIQNRQTVTYVPPLRSKMTLPLNDRDIQIAQMIRVPCVQPDPSISLTQEEFLGLPVTKKTVQKNDKRIEVWIASDLNCMAVKYVVSKPDSALGWTVEAQAEATSFTLGEPEAHLFAVPTDYRELPPVETFSELRKIRGRANVPPYPAELRMQQKYDDARK